MALNLRVPSTPTLLIPNHKQLSKVYSSSAKTLAQSEKTETGLTDQESGSSSSARAQLDLLDQLTSTSNSPSSEGYDSEGVRGGSWKLTIRDQLAQLVGDRDGDFSVALGQKNLKRMSAKFLTTSQKRNIKRQAYMDKVSKRNDSAFFATIGAFVLLPPIAILAIAILTGYVQLFP